MNELISLVRFLETRKHNLNLRFCYKCGIIEFRGKYFIEVLFRVFYF